jgi:hypothetical protein
VKRILRHLAVTISALMLGAGVASPAPAAGEWNDYEIIVWQPQSPQQYAALRRIGVTGAAVAGTRGPIDAAAARDAIAPLAAVDLRGLIENIATDFYAPYHRFQPGRAVTWLFDEVKRRYRENPRDPDLVIRQPSLADPEWQRRVAQRLAEHVGVFGPYRPLYYNLADEAGIADLAAAWDFDMAPESLEGMRRWLQDQYRSLDALNREWGTDFAEWSDVRPMTTDDALRRGDGNYAAWSDFKAWMDVSFARALAAGTAALHQADPRARSGIEGAQIPGWGGYDYTRLARAVDVMEVYDHGNNVEIAHALNPELVLLTTSAGSDRREIGRIWHAALLGGRGLILWDEAASLAGGDGAIGPRGRALAPVFAELRQGLGAQLIASASRRDPVGVLYSPVSFRLAWLLDRRKDAGAWTERDSEAEDGDSDLRAAMRRAARSLTHLGLQPRWLSPEMIAEGGLGKDGLKALILPHVLALSASEAEAIRAFIGEGGLVVADLDPGQFDEHGRAGTAPPLSDLVAAGKIRPLAALQRDFGADDPEPLVALSRLLAQAGIEPAVTIAAADGKPVTDVELRILADGEVAIISLQRDPPPDGTTGSGERIALALPRPMRVYDLRRHADLGELSRLPLELDPFEPVLLALSPAPLPAPTVAASNHGDGAVRLEFGLERRSPAARHVFHVEFLDPQGQPLPSHGANIAVAGDHVVPELPPTGDDPAGSWTVRATDLLSGQSVERRIVGEEQR